MSTAVVPIRAVEDLPPHDLAAEEAVLGSLMLRPEAVSEVAELLGSGAAFYRPAHQTIYDAVLRLYRQGKPTDPVAVADELNRRGELSRIGGAPQLHTLISRVPTAANATYHAEIVETAAVRRRLIEAGARIAQLGRDPGMDPAALLERAEDALRAVPDPIGARGGGRTLRTTLASAVTVRRLRWLWEGRIVVGGLSLLAGREGLGKSTVAVDLAARVTRGQLDGEFKGEPRAVIIVHSEDARDTTIVPRLMAAGADLDRVVFLDVVTPDAGGDIESPLVLPLDDELLVGAITTHGAALVILDAATSAIDGRLDGDKDRQMRIGLERIARIGERANAAMVGIVHFGKRDSGDTGKLILGSIAWSQVARAVLALARDDQTGELVLSPTKANLAPGDAPSLALRVVPSTIDTSDGPASVGRVEWLGDTDQRAQDLLAGPGDPDERSALDEAVEWLRAFFADPSRGGAESASTVLKAAAADGISQRTLQRARRTAGVTTSRAATGWTWGLDPIGQGASKARP